MQRERYQFHYTNIEKNLQKHFKIIVVTISQHALLHSNLTVNEKKNMMERNLEPQILITSIIPRNEPKIILLISTKIPSVAPE